MTEEVLTDNPQTVIELASRRHPNHGKRKTPNKGGVAQEAKYKKLMHEVLSDEAAKRAAQLTEAEQEFLDLIVNGTSFSEALLLTHPEKCVKTLKDGSPVLREEKDFITGEMVLRPIPLDREQVYDRGLKLADTTRCRARMRQMLEQEMADVTHTSLVVQNFVRKRLLIEAMSAPPAQRLAALKELKSYGEVAARDEERTKNLKSSEEVLDAIAHELDKLKA